MPNFVYELIAQRSQQCPDKVALEFKDEQLTYRDLNEQMEAFAQALVSVGVNRYTRVGIYLHKTFETVVSIFGTSRCGAVFVPINSVLKGQQVEHIVNDCDVQLLVTNKGRLKAVLERIDTMPSLTQIVLIDGGKDDTQQIGRVNISLYADFLKRSNKLHSYPSSIASDMAAILYTSGSTGKPKGVVLSHQNIVLGAKSVAQYLENNEHDVILAVLPFSFDYGLSQLTTTFLVGAKAVLLDYFLPNDVIKAVDKYQVTGLAAVPPLWSQLTKLNWTDGVGQSIRYFTNSGGALTLAPLTKLRELMPNAKPYLMYGLTEAFRSTYLPPNEVDNRPSSMGKAIPNAEVLVVREDGSECEANEPGELVHKGPLVSLGYWNAADKTAQRFKPAPNKPEGIMLEELAVYSGDTVKKDEQGFLYFVGRRDEMIKSSGYRVSPMEIEEVFYQFDDLLGAAAMGVPHDELGQAILVVCSMKECEQSTVDIEKALMKHCQKELANFMVPKKIMVLPALPHNANGKIDRAKLAHEYQNYFKN